MRTGISYMGHHLPRTLEWDLDRMAEIGCDDVFVAAQENDFVYMRGKLEFVPQLAKARGIRPAAIFWGALNVFGGGKTSHFLLSHPECHQVRKDGSWNSAGCYNQPAAVARIQEMIDRIASLGFEAYFVDEPTPLDCYCVACKDLYRQWCGGDLETETETEVELKKFRRWCVTNYIRTISSYVKKQYPAIETMACLMPSDRECWDEVASIEDLDNLGTDIYWVNDDIDPEEMRPLVRKMSELCKTHDKTHHEWLQCWGVKAGREERILEQGRVLVTENPASIYVWAYEGQMGTSETCENPELAFAKAVEVLRLAKSS